MSKRQENQILSLKDKVRKWFKADEWRLSNSPSNHWDISKALKSTYNNLPTGFGPASETHVFKNGLFILLKSQKLLKQTGHMWIEQRTYSNLLIITLLPLNLSGRDRLIKTTVTFFFFMFFMNTLDDVLKQSGNFHNEFDLRVSTFVTQLSMVFQFYQTLNFYTSAGVQKPAWERWLMPPIELVSSFVMCVPSILLKWLLFSRELRVRDALWIHWLLIVCAGAPLFSSFVMTVGRPLYRLNKITQLFNLATPPSTPIPVSTEALEALKPQKPAVTLRTPARLAVPSTLGLIISEWCSVVMFLHKLFVIKGLEILFRL